MTCHQCDQPMNMRADVSYDTDAHLFCSLKCVYKYRGEAEDRVKTLVLDIETSPITAHVWGIWAVNVGLNQIIEPGRILCVGAKWLHEDKVMFFKGPNMLRDVHKAMSQADVIVGFNSIQFDEKWLNAEFAKAGMLPPAPYMSVDLLRVVKGAFRLPSNKLAYVAEVLLGEAKAPTGGHQLWIDVMANKRDAWKRMQAYCEQDVLLTERLYQRVKPWIRNLPVVSLYGDAEPGQITCPGCGSNNVEKRGLAYTKLSAYQRFLCRQCGRWSRGKTRAHGVDAR